MTSSTTPTAYAVSPDSGEHWTAEGAWEVAEGIHRIPLPLPMDGLKAINVYVIATDDGLVLIDGGWAIPEARELLDRSLRSIGSGFGDIRRFLVTHIHRDHFTMATVLGHELGCRRGARHRREARARPDPPRVRRRRGEPVRPGAGHRRRPRPRRALDPWSRGRGVRPLPVAVPRHLARGRPRDPGRRPDDRRRAHPGPHPRPLRLRRPGRRAAVRRRPRAADDHAVDRLHGAADPRPARRLHGLPDQGARPAGPARSCRRTVRSRRPRTPGSTS